MLTRQLLNAKTSLGLKLNRNAAGSVPKSHFNGVARTARTCTSRPLVSNYHTASPLLCTTKADTPKSSKVVHPQITKRIRANGEKVPPVPSHENLEFEREVIKASSAWDARYQLEKLWTGRSPDQASPRARGLTIQALTSRSRANSPLIIKLVNYSKVSLRQLEPADQVYTAYNLMQFRGANRDVRNAEALMLWVLRRKLDPIDQIASKFLHIIRTTLEPEHIQPYIKTFMDERPQLLTNDRFLAALLNVYVTTDTPSRIIAFKALLSNLEPHKDSFSTASLRSFAHAYSERFLTLSEFEYWHQYINQELDLRSIICIMSGLIKQAQYLDALKWFQAARTTTSGDSKEHTELYIKALGIYVTLGRPIDYYVTLEEAFDQTSMGPEWWDEMYSNASHKLLISTYIFNRLKSPASEPYLRTLSPEAISALAIPPAPLSPKFAPPKFSLEHMSPSMVACLLDHAGWHRQDRTVFKLILGHLIQHPMQYKRLSFRCMDPWILKDAPELAESFAELMTAPVRDQEQILNLLQIFAAKL